MTLVMPLGSLCNLYDGWGKADKADGCYKQLLGTLEKEYGTDSPALVSVLNNDAKALRSLGRGEAAGQLEQKVKSIQATLAESKPN